MAAKGNNFRAFFTFANNKNAPKTHSLFRQHFQSSTTHATCNNGETNKQRRRCTMVVIGVIRRRAILVGVTV
jgi:hypothetical protein